jgi:putative tricarboxylic transport membrane protein
MTSKSGFDAPLRQAHIRWGLVLSLALLSVCALQPAFALDSEAAGLREGSLDHLTLIAPSAAGSGWDLTAQAMKQVLEGDGMVRSVEIVRVPGAGGLAGLSQFVSSRRGDGRSLLVGGMFLLGAAALNHAEASLIGARPIAQLTADSDVVVVPGSSRYHSLDDLLDAMRRNPGAMSWAGGSVGGSDHPAMWQLARAASVQPELMRYESFPEDGEVARQLASGRFSAGIGGYSEFDALIRSGKLRGLAMVSRQPMEGVNIPTFRELGMVGVSISNWCGVFAPPAIGSGDQERLEGLIRQMVQSSQWRTVLEQYHLRSAYLGAADFSQLVRQEQRRIAKSQAAAGATMGPRILSAWALTLAVGVVALLMALYWQKRSGRRREEELQRALQEVSQEVERRAREMERQTQDMAAVRVGMNAQVEREFGRWGLTSAERSVAHLTLKGLRLKDIARVRNTSDRTVRQQAQAIYRKAGLDGRTDLAAYFLEGVLGEPGINVSAAVAPTAPVGLPLPNRALRVLEPTSVG